MNYEELYQVLKVTAETCFAENTAGVGLFHYGIKEHHQQQRAEAMPQIQVDPFSDQLSTGTATQQVRVYIGFLDQDTNSSSEEQQREIAFRMEKLSRKYFGLLSDDDDLGEITVTRDFIYRFSDACLTGCVCSFTLQTEADLC